MESWVLGSGWCLGSWLAWVCERERKGRVLGGRLDLLTNFVIIDFLGGGFLEMVDVSEVSVEVLYIPNSVM